MGRSFHGGGPLSIADADTAMAALGARSAGAAVVHAAGGPVTVSTFDRLLGYPYVYAGTTDDTSDALAHGGFDCSGFVWRVFKISGLRWGRQIGGRHRRADGRRDPQARAPARGPAPAR